MWLTEGDRNTRFFHLRASQRRRRNYISKLKNQDGQFTDNQVEMGVMAIDFYMTLYTLEGPVNMNLVLDTVATKVTRL